MEWLDELSSLDEWIGFDDLSCLDEWSGFNEGMDSIALIFHKPSTNWLENNLQQKTIDIPVFLAPLLLDIWILFRC